MLSAYPPPPPGGNCPACGAVFRQSRLQFGIEEFTEEPESPKLWSVCSCCASILIIEDNGTRRMPTTEQLDQLAQSSPVFFKHLVDLHTERLTTKAAAAGAGTIQ